MDCYADWCGPCKIMAPALDDLAHERAGEVLVTKLDTDRNQATAQRFNVRAIPTLIVFRERSEEHTSELQSHSDLVCRLLLEKKKKNKAKETEHKESNT